MSATEEIKFGRHVLDLGDTQALFAAGDAMFPGQVKLFSTGYDAILCLNGKIHWSFFKKKTIQEKGEFMLIPPGMYYELLGGEDEPVIVHLRLVDKKNNFEDLQKIRMGVYIVHCDIMCSTFLEVSKEIVESTEKKQTKLDEAFIKKSKDLYAYLKLHLSNADECISPKVITEKASSSETLSKFFHVIEENNEMSVEDVSVQVGVSSSYLARIFKENFGITPRQYMNIYRINKSLESLNMEEVDLSVLSVEMGFTDQSHFTNVFKRFLMVTPGELKKQSVSS